MHERRAGISTIGCLLSALVLIAPLEAHAEGSVVMAESLFQEGRTLMSQGNYAAACPNLAESYAQDPATGTLLALSLCREKSGQYASAWAGYQEALERNKKEGRVDRAEAIQQQIANIEPKLSYLALEIAPTVASLPGFTVKRDGIRIGSGAWGSPTPIDPGEHVVEASASGKLTLTKTVVIGKEADKQRLEVTRLDDVQAAPPPAPPPEASSSTVFTPLRIAGVATGGAGIVVLGVSAYFGLHAKGLDSDSRDQGCSDRTCPQGALSTRQDAISASNVATGTLIAGGVLVAAGATLFIVGGRKSESSGAYLSATPLVGFGNAGIAVQGAL